MIATSDPVIQVNGLTKLFPGGVRAVDGLTMSVPRGAVYGLIGRNGAGKTTTLRLLLGLLRPTSGTAHVLGHSLSGAPREVRARVAYVSQTQRLPERVTPAELFDYTSRFYARWNAPKAKDLCRRFEIQPDRPLGSLSGGEQRKVALAAALAAQPEVLLLDEPAAGLDPLARRSLSDALVSVLSEERGCTVVLSTHLIDDLERLADHVGILDHGRMRLESPIEDLRSSTRRIQLIFDGTSVPADFQIPGAVRTHADGPVLQAVVRDTTEERIAQWRAIPEVRLTVFPMSLEDLFVELVSPEEPAAH